MARKKSPVPPSNTPRKKTLDPRHMTGGSWLNRVPGMMVVEWDRVMGNPREAQGYLGFRTYREYRTETP